MKIGNYTAQHLIVWYDLFGNNHTPLERNDLPFQKNNNITNINNNWITSHQQGVFGLVLISQRCKWPSTRKKPCVLPLYVEKTVVVYFDHHSVAAQMLVDVVWCQIATLSILHHTCTYLTSYCTNYFIRSQIKSLVVK